MLRADRGGKFILAKAVGARMGGELARPRSHRGAKAYALGLDAEAAACLALEADGWEIRARRLRTKAGDLDMLAEKSGLLAVIEVKARPTLSGAAEALSKRQQARLVQAAEIALAENPGWGQDGVRFDLLLVDREGRVRRIADAFRIEG